MEDAWKKSDMRYPFGYGFLDEKLQRLYSSEEKLGSIFGKFSLIAFLITCMGLFGTSLLALEQRTKEIGIRKVQGATVRDIFLVISKDFFQLVCIACAIAFPLAAYFMHNWLADFTHRTHLSWWIFAAAGFITVGIAFLTSSFQTIKAAIVNPAKSLKTE